MFLLLTAVAVIFLDQLSKQLIRLSLSPGQSVKVLWVFTLINEKNPSSAFSLLPYNYLAYLFITIAIIAFILIYYRRLKSNQRSLKLALGLELGGAIGNLTDRIIFGRVTDFLKLTKIVVNTADIAIALGILIIGWVVYSSLSKKIS